MVVSAVALSAVDHWYVRGALICTCLLVLVCLSPSGKFGRLSNILGGIFGCVLVVCHPLVSMPLPSEMPTSIVGDICSSIRKSQTSSRFTVCTSQGNFVIRSNRDVSLSYLDRVRVSGNFSPPEPARNTGEFDYQTWCRYHHVVAISSANATVELMQSRWNPHGDFISRFRRYVDETCKANLPSPTAALGSGILLSITEDIPFELQEAFGRTGTVHVLSTSGMHISVLVSSIGIVMIWLGRTLLSLTGLGLSIVVGYASGGGPAPIRAVSSLFARSLAKLLMRFPEPWHVLALSVCIAVIRDPFVVMDAGAQLSFLAVVGLIVATPLSDVIADRIRKSLALVTKVWLSLLQGLIVSVVVTLVTSPNVAYNMLHISTIAPFANIPIGFLSEWALIIGAFAVGLSGIPGLGRLLWVLLNGVLLSLAAVAKFLADVPYADLATGLMTPYLVIIMTLGTILAIMLIGKHVTSKASTTEPQYYIPWSLTKPTV